MSRKSKWSEIINRLEHDLRTRESDQSKEALDDDAWKEATKLLRSNAQILGFRFRELQPADIDDLIQRVLMKLQSLETIRRLRAAGSPDGYIFIMLRNAAKDIARHRTSEEHYFRTLQETYVAEPTTGPKFAEQTEGRLVLAEALKTLTEEEHELLRMRFWRNMSIAEIAAETGKSYSATAVRLFRIIHRLRDYLEPI